MTAETLTLAQLTTVAGVAIATNLICLVLWKTLAAPQASVDRFGPIVALGVGLVVALAAGFVLGIGGQDLAQIAINGIVGGLTSMGIYDIGKSATGG